MPARVGLVTFWIGIRATRLTIRTLGFARTVAFLGAIPRLPFRQSSDCDRPTRWSAAIDHVNGRPYGATCLDRSVFLWFLMRLHRLDADVRIGIRFDGSTVDGHAWVEHDGCVVNDAPDIGDSFKVFDDDPIGILFR